MRYALCLLALVLTPTAALAQDALFAADASARAALAPAQA